MSEVIISADQVGKRYILNHQAGGYRKFSDTLVHVAKAPLRWLKPEARDAAQTASKEDFWALKDVSFEIKQGEVVGIIGRNGAGKSTLLKVLSRITEPTTGRITLKGRVASLLEVGTGFHPELTGRENIFLNGAILGMRRDEIKAKFDEIVAFAEIERFLDTPVKRYSSGMYVRLAFAVAAHLEPEILIVDEVLAVGDAQFQAKCLGKMQDVAKGGGRTVLFVSHNMAAVSALCSTALLMRSGQVAARGDVKTIVADYLAADGASSGELQEHKLDSTLTLKRYEMSQAMIESGAALTVRLELESTVEQVLGELCLLIYTAAGQRVAIVDLRGERTVFQARPGSSLRVKIEIDRLPLVEGEYAMGLFYAGNQGRKEVLQLRTLSVLPRPSEHGSAPYAAEYRGFLEVNRVVEVQS